MSENLPPIKCLARIPKYTGFQGMKVLLDVTERPTMEVSHLWKLAIKVFKTLKSLNPDFMHTYFKKGSYFSRRKNDLVVNRAKTTTFDKNSLRTLGPKIWNPLPEDIKGLTLLPKFAEFIKYCNDLMQMQDQQIPR